MTFYNGTDCDNNVAPYCDLMFPTGAPIFCRKWLRYVGKPVRANIAIVVDR